VKGHVHEELQRSQLVLVQPKRGGVQLACRFEQWEYSLHLQDVKLKDEDYLAPAKAKVEGMKQLLQERT
jgi:hypothetical protein